MITEFLLIGVLLPVLLIAIAVGLERIEEDLDEVAPRQHPDRSALEEPEKS